MSQAVLHLNSRAGLEVTSSFPELEPITETVRDALIDGEVIVLRHGVPSYEALTDRLRVTDVASARRLAEQEPATMMAFDLLRLYGVDLTDRPLTERRRSLERLQLPAESWRASPRYDDGPALLSATREQGLEGVVAKRAGSTYQPGRRSPDWVKTAHRFRDTCVVGGWLPAGDAGVGVLLVGVPSGNGRLRYAGRVERGIGSGCAQDLHRTLAELTAPASPFDGVPDVVDARWCLPRLVVDVRHLGWSTDGLLRDPAFRGVHDDLNPAQAAR